MRGPNDLQAIFLEFPQFYLNSTKLCSLGYCIIELISIASPSERKGLDKILHSDLDGKMIRGRKYNSYQEILRTYIIE